MKTLRETKGHVNSLSLKLAVLMILLIFTQGGRADCVIGAKSKTYYTRLDAHTIVLSGGYGGNILIKTFGFIYPTSDVVILKDVFCSYEDAVLYIDGGSV